MVPTRSAGQFLDRNRFGKYDEFPHQCGKMHQIRDILKWDKALKGKGLRIYVEDNGIGSTDDGMTKVFTRFEKLNEFLRRVPDLGFDDLRVIRSGR